MKSRARGVSLCVLSACLWCGPLQAQQTLEISVSGMASSADSGTLVLGPLPVADCGVAFSPPPATCSVPWTCAPGDTDLALATQLTAQINLGCGAQISAVQDGNRVVIDSQGSSFLGMWWYSTLESGGLALPLFSGHLPSPSTLISGCEIRNVCNGIAGDHAAAACGGFTISGVPQVREARIEIAVDGAVDPLALMTFALLDTQPSPCPPATVALPAALCEYTTVGALVTTPAALAADMATALNGCIAGVDVTASGTLLLVRNDPSTSGVAELGFGMKLQEPIPTPARQYGLPGGCSVNNVMNGVDGDEGSPPVSGFRFQRLADSLASIELRNGLGFNRSLLTAPRAVLGEPWVAQVDVDLLAVPSDGLLILLFHPNCLTVGPQISLFGGPVSELLIGPVGFGQPCPPGTYSIWRGKLCSSVVIPNNLNLVGSHFAVQAVAGTPSAGFVLTNALCGTVGTR